MKPKTLDKKATEIFNKIIARIPENEGHVRIGEPGGPIMPLSVERLSTFDIGKIYSLAHYYELNGDLCQDPEMCFILTWADEVMPCMFQQAIPPVYQESIYYNDGWKLHPKIQQEHVEFANEWLRNIEWQQDL